MAFFLSLSWISVIFLIVFIRYLYIKKSRFHQLAAKIPCLPTLPLIGNFHQCGRTWKGRMPLEKWFNVVRYSQKELGSEAVGVWWGPFYFVCTFHPDDIEFFLGNTKVSRKAEQIYRFARPWLGDGLLSAEGEIWAKGRKLVTPAFHFSILKSFLPTFDSLTGIFLDQIRNNGYNTDFPVYKASGLLALDIITESSMGIELSAQTKSSEYAEAVMSAINCIRKRITSPWLYPDFIFNLSSTGKIFKKNLEILWNTILKIIEERRAKFAERRFAEESNGTLKDPEKKRPRPLLDLLLEYSQTEGDLTNHQIRDQVDTFMTAAYDTTRTALAFTMWSLAQYQDIQEQVFEEILNLLPEKDTCISTTILTEMKYLEQVIKEALRLYSPIPVVARELVEDATCPSGGFIIPKGSIIVVFIAALHRNPKVFPNPEKFDPERFTMENSRGRHPYAYIPFSAGPRNCIGQKYAMMEMKTVLAKVIRNFKILQSPRCKSVSLEFDVTLNSSEELVVRFEPRNT